MFKSIQTKIILILILISLVMIIGTGIFYIGTLEKSKKNIVEQEVIQKDIDNTKTVLIIVSTSFAVIRYSCNNIFF